MKYSCQTRWKIDDLDTLDQLNTHLTLIDKLLSETDVFIYFQQTSKNRLIVVMVIEINADNKVEALVISKQQAQKLIEQIWFKAVYYLVSSEVLVADEIADGLPDTFTVPCTMPLEQIKAAIAVAQLENEFRSDQN